MPRTKPGKSIPVPAASTEHGAGLADPQHPFLIVGVGASAGGMEAFGQLLHHLPSDSGAAYVLVQHLAPDHDSILAELLSRKTTMPVREATDGVKIEPNQVWVIPPATEIALTDGHLHLSPRQRSGPHMPVDLFLRTLADVQGPLAIGVVLSGTGTDGTLGVRAVRAAGGIAIAQDPESAKYDGMPRSAAVTGGADLVLAPAEIAIEITRLAKDPGSRPASSDAMPDATPSDADGLVQILHLLRRVTGTDFAGYKKPTLMRRIRRRMALRGIDTIGGYVEALANDAGEAQGLHQDLLINVTSFFRDQEVFAALAETVLPPMLRDRDAGAPARIWVPGCSTGEEVYSLAICLVEAVAELRLRPEIQIFATDVSERVIERARGGIYPENIAGDVSPARLARHFAKTDQGYQVSKQLRDLCVFAVQDLTRDPPFSRLDLIACRNVLIYLEPGIQRRVLSNFHYALNPQGLLWLGSSESTGSAADLFTVVDQRHKLFRRNPNAARFPLGLARPTAERWPAAIRGAAPDPSMALQRQANSLLLARYGPAGVLVNQDLQVLEFHGDTRAYLSHAHGTASLGLLSLVDRSLLPALRKAIQQARTEGTPARAEGLQLPAHLSRTDPTPAGPAEVPEAASAAENGTLALEVIPLRAGGSAGEQAFLVLFEESGRSARRSEVKARPVKAGERARHIEELERELAALRLRLQSTTEEHDAANEELQSANEEILSSNEELQSINEELETAKEELQSANEELTTVNEELQNRNVELGRTTDDVENIMASVAMPIVVLDADMRIRRFTTAAAKLFNLIAGDVGRPLADIRPNFEAPELQRHVAEAIETASVRESEIQDREGRAYSVRVRPNRAKDRRVEGAVVVFVDVQKLRQLTRNAEFARDVSDAIIATIHQPLVLLDGAFQVQRANAAFYESYGSEQQLTEGGSLFEIGDGQWDVPELRRLLEDVLPLRTRVDHFLIEREFSGLGFRVIEINARRLEQAADRSELILIALDDRTEERKMEIERANLAIERKASEVTSQLKDEFVANASHELRGPLNAMAGWTHLLATGQIDAAKTSHALEAIDRAIKAQTRLIEDLFDVSRIMAGKLRLNLGPVDLLPAIESALATAGSAAEAKLLRLTLAPSSSHQIVLGDSDRLQQVIWNLVSNAVKFTPRGGAVDVALGREGTSVVLRVHDTGQGIAPSFLPFVFDRFRQAESQPSRKQAGLGLGLAIVRHVVELHGGTVEASSPGKDQGATFTVTLPVPPLVMPAPAGRPQLEHDQGDHATLPAAEPGALAGVDLLVVEDDRDSREMLEAVLTAAGAAVRTAESAASAMKLLAEAVPDVLLSDIGMPGEDGYEFLSRVRKLPAERGGQVPALALTAYVAPTDRERVIAAGFQGHLAKPAVPTELIAKIRWLVGRGAL